MARNCVHCETRQGMDRFQDETFSIEHAGLSATIDGLSGWRCAACSEVEFDADSARIYAAGDALVLQDRQHGWGNPALDSGVMTAGISTPSATLKETVYKRNGVGVVECNGLHPIGETRESGTVLVDRD